MSEEPIQKQEKERKGEKRANKKQTKLADLSTKKINTGIITKGSD